MVRAGGARDGKQVVCGRRCRDGMNARVELEELMDAGRVERLRQKGALVLDVDDTLLARVRADGGAGEETFAESAAAAGLPELLRRGFRVCLITGHGWRQLEARLVAPVIENLRESGKAACVERLRVYANRGATKIVCDGARREVDEVYGERYQLRAEDVPALSRLLESLWAEFEVDVKARGRWYEAAFPRFDFSTLPARVSEREGAVLVLRPVPSRIHAAADDAAATTNPRAELYARGLELLQRARLSDRYELAESGRSSIEITRRGVSKEAAMRDAMAELSASSGACEGDVEEASVYVGDEFFAGGNDYVIPQLFPRALCLSVAGGHEAEAAAGVVSLARMTGAAGTAATERFLAHILRLSARV
ncbi:MAG TPA: hypothetical protein VER76_05575 [Pyrinomonadaceae bacterium]|nr:hypothetical protein [Pyrinomonadaceae bacterium]